MLSSAKISCNPSIYAAFVDLFTSLWSGLTLMKKKESQDSLIRLSVTCKIHFKGFYILFSQVTKIRSVTFITDMPDGPVTICQCNLTSRLNTRSKSGANVDFASWRSE